MDHLFVSPSTMMTSIGSLGQELEVPKVQFTNVKDLWKVINCIRENTDECDSLEVTGKK